MSIPNNGTGTRFESFIDTIVAKVDASIKTANEYLETANGKANLKKIDTVAKIAIALLFAYTAPLTLTLSLITGGLVGVYSNDQLPRLVDKIALLGKNIPRAVNALGATFAVVAAPWTLAVAAGLWIGSDFGTQYAGSAIAKAAATVADQAVVPNNVAK
jgi:hypothetical protein